MTDKQEVASPAPVAEPVACAPGDPAFENAIEDAAKAAFTKAQSVYRKDHDHFPIRNTWGTATESVRDGWRSIAYAAVEAATTPPLGTQPEPRRSRALRFEAGDALVAEPGEPVAWEQRHRENSGEWSKWYPTSKKAFDLIGTKPDGALQARPLYAAPPARQDGALREALDLDAAVSAAACTWCWEKDRETFQSDVDYFKCNWRALGGLTAYVDREIGKRVRAALAQSAAPVQPEPVRTDEIITALYIGASKTGASAASGQKTLRGAR